MKFKHLKQYTNYWVFPIRLCTFLYSQKLRQHWLCGFDSPLLSVKDYKNVPKTKQLKKICSNIVHHCNVLPSEPNVTYPLACSRFSWVSLIIWACLENLKLKLPLRQHAQIIYDSFCRNKKDSFTRNYLSIMTTGENRNVEKLVNLKLHLPAEQSHCTLTQPFMEKALTSVVRFCSTVWYMNVKYLKMDLPQGFSSGSMS